MKDFTELDVWKESRVLANLVYKLSENFPNQEMFGLTQQIRRSSVSVPSNIAEGLGRNTFKDTKQFMYVARGSLFETQTQAFIAYDLDYITKEQLEEINIQIKKCVKLLNGFIRYLKSKK